MGNGAARHGTTQARARHNPMGFRPARPTDCSCRAEEAFVPGYWPRHDIMGRFSGRAGPMSLANVAGRVQQGKWKRGRRRSREGCGEA